jgi:microsomal prostaglandin-E synthase 1
LAVEVEACDAAIVQSPAQIFAFSAALLGVHLVLLALWTGTVRVRRKQWINPEDAALNKGAQVDSEHPDVLRVKRAHANALENAVPYFAIGALYVASSASRTGALVYCMTFLVARVAHTFFYLAGKQPFRTMSFAIGVLCIFGMAFHVVRAAL